jgi:hypothetical protein
VAVICSQHCFPGIDKFSPFLFCSKVIFGAMDASIGGRPGVNPPHAADTDTTDLEDEELAPGDDGRFHPPGSEYRDNEEESDRWQSSQEAQHWKVEEGLADRGRAAGRDDEGWAECIFGSHADYSQVHY